MFFYSHMQAYKRHLDDKGQDGSMVNSTIEFLKYTSKTIALFHKYSIKSTDDSRLRQLEQFLEYLTNWKTEASSKTEKLWFDLQSMILGFQTMVSIKLTAFPQCVIKPAIVNRDVIENHFCQARACNGQNSNPTYRLQETCQNSIRYGQTTVSRKSNAGLSGQKITA